MLFHIFADDVTTLERSDVTVYYISSSSPLIISLFPYSGSHTHSSPSPSLSTPLPSDPCVHVPFSRTTPSCTSPAPHVVSHAHSIRKILHLVPHHIISLHTSLYRTVTFSIFIPTPNSPMTSLHGGGGCMYVRPSPVIQTVHSQGHVLHQLISLTLH